LTPLRTYSAFASTPAQFARQIERFLAIERAIVDPTVLAGAHPSQ
jgi:hypothetical protein